MTITLTKTIRQGEHTTTNVITGTFTADPTQDRDAQLVTFTKQLLATMEHKAETTNRNHP